MQNPKSPLSIDPLLPEILHSLRAHPNLVVSASPGAGKTTRLPPELLHLTEKKVLVLEPRRIAAISASQRIADENGWQLGKEVGYSVRFDQRSSKETRLLFLTEALLLRKLLQDPKLGEIGCVVLDEFHERSIHVDLAISALKELQELERPDLKIVVMSATLDATPLSAFLQQAPVIEVPGKIFPLSIRYEDKSQLLRTGPDFTDRMKRLLQKASGENSGDILCFLPGRGEIDWLFRSLEDWASGQAISLHALHGQLSLQEQKAALQPSKQGRKIILATNVAESSLTVEGVSVVVDSGLARISQLHPRTGFSSLDLVRISKASATQRAGRAARRGPGVVYRAWNPFDEKSMKEFEAPEIQRSDLSESLLLLSALGVNHFESFSWFEKPQPHLLEKAKSFLQSIGALQEDGTLTSVGKELRQISAHPRMGKLLLEGKARGSLPLACEMAALLQEPHKSPGGGDGLENDLLLLWEDWKHQPHRYKMVQKAAEQWLSSFQESHSKSKNPEIEMLELLLKTFPDRLSRRRQAGQAQAKMAGGRGVKLHPESTVKESEFFLSLELSEGRDVAETLVFQAVGIPKEMVEKNFLPFAETKTALEWDEEKNRFWVVETKEWNGLSLAHETRRPANSEEIEGRLAEIALARWDRLVGENESLSHWLARLRFLHSCQPKWPLLTEEQKREGLEMACFGENSLAKVREKDLVPFFSNLLSPEHQDALARECPMSWLVPSGSRLKIQYTADQGAQVEVRLQELFGLPAAPKVAGQSLTLILLAPNYRPVQVTRDLESFWKSAYSEVRKEMRSRYPKHSWPEDPLSAAPQAKGRPRNLV